MPGSERKFFFVHVMKTAGGTLRRHIFENFERSQVYPYGEFDPDLYLANFELGYLTSLPDDRLEQIRVFTGHFPFVAVELLGLPLTTLTILREPVERTISYLRANQRLNRQHRDLPLEQIYEDEFFFPTLIKNHQAKIFAMTASDRPKSYMDVVEIDASRLETAKANLERVDVIGLQAHFEEFLGELGSLFGWKFGTVENKNVDMGEGRDVPPSFRRRIAEENRADMEFFEFARELWDHRRRERRAA